MLGGVSYDVTDRFNLSGEVSLAPDAEIYPRVSGWVELSSPVMNRLVLYLNLKASEYKDVHLYAIAFAGEYYLGNWALLSRYTVSESDFDSGGSSTDEAIYVKITYYLSDDDEIYAYYSHGNEAYKVETVDTIGDIRADIYGVGGTYFITPAVGVSAGYEFQKREGGTEYRQIGLEIKYRM
jgi:YaiO family outer membrane protein